MDNRRQHPRIDCMLSCEVTFSTGKREQVFILDISEGGMFVQYDHLIEINSELQFRVINGDREELFSGSGMIVWHTDQLFGQQKQGFGVLFTELVNGAFFQKHINALTKQFDRQR